MATEDDIQFVKETIKVINKHEVTWVLPEEEEEKQFEIERAQVARGVRLVRVEVVRGRAWCATSRRCFHAFSCYWTNSSCVRPDHLGVLHRSRIDTG
jgi:hypothetical protein